MTTKRKTKSDRVLEDAAAVAAALPGTWGIVTDLTASLQPMGTLLISPDGEMMLSVHTGRGRAWGYHLRPNPPHGLTRHYRHFLWMYNVECPWFKVGTPPEDVAANVEEHLLPRYRDALNRTRADQQRHAQQCEQYLAALGLHLDTEGDAETPPRHRPPEFFHDPGHTAECRAATTSPSRIT